MTIGEKIKYIRTARGITQEELAAMLQVSRSAIAKWEANGGLPEISNLKLLSAVLQIPVDDLIDDTKTIAAVTAQAQRIEPVDLGDKKEFYDIDLQGWSTGVFDALLTGEDKDFLFYQRQVKKSVICGFLGKRYITNVQPARKQKRIVKKISNLDRKYFCDKPVYIEMAYKEGFFKGFFDIHSDAYRNVRIHAFSDTKLLLKFGREVDIKTITKVEEV